MKYYTRKPKNVSKTDFLKKEVKITVNQLLHKHLQKLSEKRIKS